MSTEENKTKSTRVIEEGINKNNFDAIASVIAADYVEHQPPPPGAPTGLEGFKVFLTQFRSAFPGFHYTIDNTIAEGDKVGQQITGHGTMTGSFAGMPATGKQVSWGEVHISRFKDGKVVEHWAVIDQLGMLRQLGLVPTPGG